MHVITPDRLLTVMNRNQYPVHHHGQYNLNLIGIRHKDRISNRFDDTLIVLYWLDGVPMMHRFPITTDPGTYYREHPVNVSGTAVLAPGHYPRCWRIGFHKNQYKALVQRGDMAVYRDDDRNASIDLDQRTIQVGRFGINLHRAGRSSNPQNVDKWSAGCQVFQHAVDFDLVMALAYKSADLFGPDFSYTLLDESEC